MTTDDAEAEDESRFPITRTDVHLIISIFIGSLIAVQAWDITHVEGFAEVWGTAPEAVEDLTELGHALFTDWAIPLEALGVLLLVALVGALAMAMRERGGTPR